MIKNYFVYVIEYGVGVVLVIIDIEINEKDVNMKVKDFVVRCIL